MKIIPRDWRNVCVSRRDDCVCVCIRNDCQRKKENDDDETATSTGSWMTSLTRTDRWWWWWWWRNKCISAMQIVDFLFAFVWSTTRKSQRIRRITSMSFDIETNWIHLFISHLFSPSSRGETNANHWSAPPIIAEETKSTDERRRRILLIQMNVRRMKARSSPFWEERKRRWSA